MGVFFCALLSFFAPGGAVAALWPTLQINPPKETSTPPSLPVTRHSRIDTLVAMETDVPNHSGKPVEVIRHSPSLVFIGLQHIGMEAQTQKVTDVLDSSPRLTDQVLKLDLAPSFLRYLFKKFQYVLVADQP